MRSRIEYIGARITKAIRSRGKNGSTQSTEFRTQRKSRFFLLDQSLKSYSGHCYEYFLPIERQLNNFGLQTHLVGHKSMDDTFAKQTGAVPLFTLWCDERFQSSQRTISDDAELTRENHERLMKIDLHNLHRQFSLTSEDVIIFNTLRHWALRAVPIWLEELPVENRPKIFIVLHFTPTPDAGRFDYAVPYFSDAFRAIEDSSVRNLIHLSADADILIDEYKELTNLPIELAPIPHISDTTQRASRRGSGAISVGYVGEARLHKGFHLLPYLATSFLKSELKSEVKFQIHAFCANPDQDFYRSAVANLETLPNVDLFYEVLSPSDYAKFVQSLDVILIPYSLSNYYAQTSGIYAEALGYGIPTIVSRGTWMAKRQKELGGGRECIAADYLSLTDETFKLCSEYDRYADEAETARSIWISQNSADAFLRMIRNAGVSL